MIDFILPFFKWSFIIVLSLLLIGILFEQYSRWRLEKKAFKGKTFIEINEKRLHYVKKGWGDCTVVFESGMGSSHAIWQEIQDSISKYAVTISYDRNGLMLSEANDLAITNNQVTDELEMLLEKTNCPKPFIIVAHSMGGIYLRPFIERNKEHIGGVIFAEAAHPKQLEKASPQLLKALYVPPIWLIRFVVNTGIYRTLFSFLPLSPEIPIDHPLHQSEKNFFYRSYDKLLEELANDKINFKDAEKYTSFGNTPLTVIMGTSTNRYAAIKDVDVKNEYQSLINELQHDLLKLSSRSKFIQTKNSGHILQIKDSNLLITEIRNMLLLREN